MRWFGRLLIVFALARLPPAAGEECLEVVNLGSCGPWAVGKYHKQDDEHNNMPVWHNAGDHVGHVPSLSPLPCALC